MFIIYKCNWRSFNLEKHGLHQEQFMFCWTSKWIGRIIFIRWKSWINFIFATLENIPEKTLKYSFCCCFDQFAFLARHTTWFLRCGFKNGEISLQMFVKFKNGCHVPASVTVIGCAPDSQNCFVEMPLIAFHDKLKSAIKFKLME